MMRKRIALLRGDDSHHRYLDWFLSSRFDVVCRIEEPARWQRAELLRRGRYVSFTYALYHLCRRRLSGLDSYRRAYFRIPESQLQRPDCLVRSINTSPVWELLETAAPDLTIIICTSILAPRTLRAAGPLVVNIHGGFLPDYRGNHCFFFALWNAEFNRIGSTIHHVDAGIDTGDIIEHVIPDIRPDDSAETLYCRADKMAIHRLEEWITHLEAGGTLPRLPQPYLGRLYRTRDRGPLLDLLMWWRRRSGSLSLPDLPAPLMPPIADLSAVSPFSGADRQSFG